VADSRYLAELEEKKRASMAQLLFRAARLLNERAIERARKASGVTTLRAAHTALLPHLDFVGIRLTDLADRLGVSKQATFELVEELVAQGMVERRDDPADGRAKLIRFSKKGERALLDGLRILGDIERELEGALGRARFHALHDALLSLMPLLESPEANVPAVEPTKPAAPKPRARASAATVRRRR
jgi:DNA-binding MarR family transcriptional regulator